MGKREREREATSTSFTFTFDDDDDDDDDAKERSMFERVRGVNGARARVQVPVGASGRAACVCPWGIPARRERRKHEDTCQGQGQRRCLGGLEVEGRRERASVSLRALHHDEAYQVAQVSLVSISAFEQLLGKVGFGSLFATTGLYWGKAAFGNLKEHGKVEKGTMAAANAALLLLLCLRWIDAGHFPLSNLYESLLFLSWGISSVHFYLALRIPQSGVAGTLTSPTALGVLAFATLILPPELQKATALVPALKSNWLFMHVSVMMMSYATLLVGSLMSFGYLLIDQFKDFSLSGMPDVEAMLKSATSQVTSAVAAEQQPQVVMEMEAQESTTTTTTMELSQVDAVKALDASSSTSSEGGNGGKTDLLDTCDDLAYRSIGLGFAFLTIGIISGAVWANEAWGSYWSWDPKETWALITWLFYAIYLHGRIYKDWSPKTTAAVSASGFVIVWICYVGVNLFGVGLHSYGFFK